LAIAGVCEEATMVEERELLFERYLERLSGGAAYGTGRASRKLPDFEALRVVEAVARERNSATLQARRAYSAAARRKSSNICGRLRLISGLSFCVGSRRRLR
jgi:hypothetical protein